MANRDSRSTFRAPDRCAWCTPVAPLVGAVYPDIPHPLLDRPSSIPSSNRLCDCASDSESRWVGVWIKFLGLGLRLADSRLSCPCGSWMRLSPFPHLPAPPSFPCISPSSCRCGHLEAQSHSCDLSSCIAGGLGATSDVRAIGGSRPIA